MLLALVPMKLRKGDIELPFVWPSLYSSFTSRARGKSSHILPNQNHLWDGGHVEYTFFPCFLFLAQTLPLWNLMSSIFTFGYWVEWLDGVVCPHTCTGSGHLPAQHPHLGIQCSLSVCCSMLSRIPDSSTSLYWTNLLYHSVRTNNIEQKYIWGSAL